MFRNRQKQVQARIGGYCEEVARCMWTFQKALTDYCRDSIREQLQGQYIEIHKFESHADDIRREVEVMLYTKGLFPESRGDILGLLETMDRVPNQAESSVRMILNQHISIPDEYAPEILQLVDVSCRSAEAMLESARCLFTNYTSATVAIGKIDELESDGDRIESDMIEKIFTSNMDGFEKILLRDFVKHLSQIADRAENVGDRIRIIVAKRSI